MKARLTTLITIVLAILAFTVAVSAGTVTVGVSKDQTFDYSYQIL